MRLVIFVALIAVGAYLFIQQLPDIQRYLKMRQM
jgi:hypothetical protein